MSKKTYRMFADVAIAERWTLEAQVDVLLRYIAQQDSHEAFADYLSEQCRNDDGEEV